MTYLDSDLLRGFLAVAETGSMTDGAARIFRTQSAVSLQIKRLETLLDQPVFERHGRGVNLTATGETLLPIAREITARLDNTLANLSAKDISGRLCFGIPDDHGRDHLAQIIGEFTRAHPGIELDVTCDLSTGFPEALRAGKLDLAVYEVAQPKPTDEVLMRDQTFWMCSKFHDLTNCDPMPVALFDRDCWWRDAALEALTKIGKPYRVIYSSQSVGGVIAAIEAGSAVGLLGHSSLTPKLRTLGPKDGFLEMPVSHLVLGIAKQDVTAACSGLADAIRRAFSTSN